MFPFLSTCPNSEENPPASTENENRSRLLIKRSWSVAVWVQAERVCIQCTAHKCRSHFGRMVLRRRPCPQDRKSFLPFFSFLLFFFFLSFLFVLTRGRTAISRMSLPRLRGTENSKIETRQGDLPSLPVPSHSPSKNNCLKDKMADLRVAQPAKVEQEH